MPARPAWIAGWGPPTWHHALAPPRAIPCQVTNVLMAAGISVSSANINTGSGEGPVRDVFRVTDGEGKKVGGRTVAPLGARATHALHCLPRYSATSCRDCGLPVCRTRQT